MERRYNSMKRINKGTQLIVGDVERSTISALTPLRLRCNTALSILSPLEIWGGSCHRSAIKQQPASIHARAVRICRSPHTIYEPLLGENRELGEKRDSTLRTNTGLI